MEFSNKKLQKAFEYCENGKYKEALKLCSKVLNKEYNNEEALTLEGEILYKAGRIDDAIITWKINAEYNKNALAQRHLDSLDTNVKQMALSYTSIYSENEEYRRLVIDAYKESTNKDKDNTKSSTSSNEATVNTEIDKNNKTTDINEVKAEPIKNEAQKPEKVVVEKETPKEVEIKASSTLPKEEPKVIEVKKEEPKVVEVKKEEPKVVEVKKEEPKVAEVKKEEPKVAEVKKEEPKVAEVKKEEPKVVEVKKEEPKVAETKKEENNSTSKEESTFERISVASRRSSSVNRHNSFNKKIIAIVVAGVIIVAGGFGIYKASSSSKPKAPENTIQTQTPPKVDWSTFNSDMQNAINSQNYNEIYTLLTKAPEKEVPQAETAEYQAGLKAMQDNGIQYYYNQGMTDFSNKQYNQAIDLFQKGLKFADGNYLAPHLTYYIGAAYSGLGNHDKAVEYYKLYLKNFPNANIYNSGCLYVLAKYYFSQGHVKEAQQYAQELQNQFPNSPYNNNDISNILANK